MGDVDGRFPRTGSTVPHQKPGGDPCLEHVLCRDGVPSQSDELGSSRLSPGRLTGGSDHHQALEHPAHQPLLRLSHPHQERVGAGADGTVHTTELVQGFPLQLVT